MNLDEPAAPGPSKNDLLSFKPTGRWLAPDAIEAEFALMSDVLSKPLTPAMIEDIATASGTHLLKAITPRAESGQAVLRAQPPGTNLPPELYPSTNAPQIPYAKVIFRPLEIEGHPPMSVVDAIMTGEGPAQAIVDGFEATFGNDCLVALREALQAGPVEITTLPLGEFPIVFAPGPDGEDLQITPISPIAAFTGFKEMSNPYFRKKGKDEGPIARGQWMRQEISSQMQNISGKIGGSRQRFLATMPDPMARGAADLNRFARGGSFPYWHDPEISDLILAYVKLCNAKNNSPELTAGRDRRAHALVERALDFINDMEREARDLIKDQGLETTPGKTPSPARILFARKWPEKVRADVWRALGSPHFSRIQHDVLERRKGA